MANSLETMPIEEPSTEVINCPSCEAKIHADVGQCPACGQNVPAGAPGGPPRQVAIWAILVPMLVMLAAYFFLTAILPYIYRAAR